MPLPLFGLSDLSSKAAWLLRLCLPPCPMALSWFLVHTHAVHFILLGESTQSGLDGLRKREEATTCGSGLATIERDSKKESLLNEVELATISTENKVNVYIGTESS